MQHGISEDIEDDIPIDIPTPIPTPPLTATEALYALATLNTYFEALPVSSLQHHTTIPNTFEVSDIVSCLQTIALFSEKLPTEQRTATDFAWMAVIKFRLTASSG